MTDKQAAIEALNYIQHSWQEKDGQTTFQEECEIIRAALKSNVAPVDVEGLKKDYDADWKEAAIRNVDVTAYTIGYNQAIDDMNAKGYLNTPQWQEIETAPRDGKVRTYGLWVNNTLTGERNFEQYELYENDEGDLRLAYEDDFFSAWSYSDFTHWQPLPQTPEDTE